MNDVNSNTKFYTEKLDSVDDTLVLLMREAVTQILRRILTLQAHPMT